MKQTSGDYSVVFQLSNNDTFVQKSLIRHLGNLLEAMPGIRIEVVLHGFGIDLLLKDSPFGRNVEDLKQRGVHFLVCENTIKAENLEVSDLPGLSSCIPAGIAHIIKRQGEGWAYIKAGY